MHNVPESGPICASALGEELTGQECQVLAGIMTVRQLKDGELLVAEGAADSALYLVARGGLAVVSQVGGQEAVVYTMTQGECAGTRAFIDRSTRKATLRSVGDTVVYSMAPETFESLLAAHPRIVYKVMRALFRITHSNLMRMNLESQQLSNYISKTRGRY